MADIAGFVNQYLPYAQSVSNQTGLPVDFILGQSALETGYGTSNAAVNYNNFFGIKPGGQLAVYPDVSSGFQAYANLIQSPRYSGVTSVVNQGPQSIAQYLAQAGYTPDPGYSQSVASAVAQIDSVLGNLGGTSQTSTGQAPGTTSPGSGSAAGGTAAQPAAKSATLFDPSTWLPAIGSWLGHYASAAALVVIGLILLIGAVMMFTRQQKVI